MNMRFKLEVGHVPVLAMVVAGEKSEGGGTFCISSTVYA